MTTLSLTMRTALFMFWCFASTNNAFAFSPPLQFVPSRSTTPCNNRLHVPVLLRSSSASASSSSSDKFDMSELSRRMDSIAGADALEQKMAAQQQEQGGGLLLPVVAFDSLLPHQRLSGSTTDPTFSRMLRDLGLGGLFVMTSVDQNRRLLRRNGVVAKIEVVDAKGNNNDDDHHSAAIIPTAVDFSVVGRRRCRVVGPSKGMVTRVGRWRRSYDPDGEETMLGWANERFLEFSSDDLSSTTTSSETLSNDDDDETTKDDVPLQHTEWTLNQVDCSLVDSDHNNEKVIQHAESIIPLLEKWQDLASNTHTYDNVDVVAATRAIRGQPGLRVDPARLLQNVLRDIGERPEPTDPTAFALWGAALINPLPALGISPEIRGRILEAPTTKRRLEILEWGATKSIRNLQGIAPL